MSRNQMLIGGLVLLLLIGGVWFLAQNNQSSTSEESLSQSTDAPNNTPESTVMGESTDSGQTANVKEFTVSGSNFKFEPATLTVNKGDTVKITFKNTSGIHDFVIDELNVETKTINGGQEETVEFTADQTGSFEFYCSVGNHRAMGMKGTLIVQ